MTWTPVTFLVNLGREIMHHHVARDTSTYMYLGSEILPTINQPVSEWITPRVTY